MATYRPRPQPIRAHTDFAPDVSCSERLLVGLAKTLAIDESDILLTDSFSDLGGDETSAVALEERLQRYGVCVSTDLIMRCKTVAELQAHARPVEASSPSQSSSGDSTGDSMYSGQLDDRVFTPTRMHDKSESVYGPPPPLDLNAPRNDGRAKIAGHEQVEPPTSEAPKSQKALDKEPANIQIDLDGMQELQHFLSSAARGEYFCLLKAEAGPFHDQLVAFVSTQQQSAGEAKGISLPPEKENKHVERRIKKFHTALREWGGSAPWPDVWIPLRSMVTKSNGKPATRALQWWLKNLENETEQRVLSLQRLISLQLLGTTHQPGGHTPSHPAEPNLVPTHGSEATPTLSSTTGLFPQPPSSTSALQLCQPQPKQPVRKAGRGQPDVVVFKPEPVSDEEEIGWDRPEEEIEIALQEAKAVPIAEKIAQLGRENGSTTSNQSRLQAHSQRDTLVGQSRLSSTRPDKTFSMFIEDESGRLEVHERMDAAPDDVEFFPLSAMQQLFFRTSMHLDPRPNSIAEQGYRFGQSVMLRVKTNVEPSDIESAVAALVKRHSMLRSRFRLTRERWAQVILPESQNTYRYGHHQVFSTDEITSVTGDAHASINPIYGPVFATEHIRSSNGEQFIFLVAHHLAVDLISWRIMIRDMDELLRKGTLLSNPSIPFSNWIEYQGYESSHRLVQPTLPFEIPAPSLGYWDFNLKENRYRNTTRFDFSLDAELTYTLRTACQNIFRTEPCDVFLTALLLSFCQTFPDREAPTLWSQEHGRETKNEDFNIDETVGWFSSLCPTSIMATPDSDFMELLKLVKDTRKAIPDRGIPFFNTEFSTPSAPFTTIPVEIMFSCVDNMHELHRRGGILEPVSRPDAKSDSVTSDIGPDVGRIALFEVNVSIEQAEATVEATCIQPPPKRDRIEKWFQQFQLLLTTGINKLNGMGPQLTLADAPLLKTTYQGLSKLAERSISDLGLDDVGEIETIYPVSPSQQEILIAQSLDPTAFWVHAIYELGTAQDKPISQGKLCTAWSSIVESHAALRSVFVDSATENGLFDQLVLRRISPDMLFLDSDTPVETLASLPSMRVSPGRPKHRLSVCNAAGQTFIRLDASQAICDTLALDNILTRLRMVYANEKSRPSDNTSLLRTWLYNATTADTFASLQAWQGSLTDAKPCIFPALTVKPDNHQSPQSSFSDLHITRRELHDFSVQHEVDAVYVLQLAWALVLRAYVGIDHVSFGYEMTGRDATQMLGMKKEVGSFAASTPCTVDLAPSRTIIECLQSLVEVAAVGRENQVPTMAEVQHAMKLNTDELFNTCLSMRDFDNARHKYPELDADSFRATMVTSARFSNCDLSLSSMFIDDNLHINLSFRKITSTQAQNIMHTFERATRLILDGVNDQVSSVDLFTDRDYAQLIAQDFESSLTENKSNKCVHQLILPHAQKHPEAPAICSWDGNMTYHQMVYCVATLATYLRNLGVLPGMPVPIVMEKTKWAPIIMLAVLKAGGSLVCLDSSDRHLVEGTVTQLNPRIVVATDTAWSNITYPIPNLIIVNERFFSTLPPQVSIPMQEPKPEHAACIMYTPSRSKSNPSRSLFFTHSSLSLAFLAQGPALKLNRHSRVLQLSAFNVDVALVEILGTMVHGGCVCIPSSKDRLGNPGAAMARMRVTWSYMTLSLARRIDPSKVPKLRTICFRTRRLDEDTRQLWLPNRNILLAYGAPDICPLGISIAEISGSSTTTVIPPPLMGRFWILNPEDPKKLMPLGSVGELAIDCPHLTPHKFVPGQRAEALPTNTSSQERQHPTRQRYLKTGHRGRYLDDGSIQFLSSMRDEVLVDGSRVSVSDIEHQLRRCLGVKFDIVVEAVTTSDSIQLLAAFLEIGDEGEQDPDDLENLRMKTKERTQLAKALRRASSSNGPVKGLTTDHIPSVFIPLKQFPLSSSLKVHRRKLQKMISGMNYKEILGVSTTTSADEAEAGEKPLPLTNVEERMRHVWASVLDILPAKIKGSNSFIGLGGDRYLATKLVVAARRSSLRVSLKDVLKGATLTEVSQAIAVSEILPMGSRPSERQCASSETFKIPGFDEGFIKNVIAPLTKAHYSEILDLAEASAYQIHGLESRMYGQKGGIKCVVFNFNGPIRSQKLKHACETLAQLHLIFRTGFVVHERHVYQVLFDGFIPEFQRFSCPAWCLGSVADNVIAEDQDVAFKPEEPATKFTFLDAGHQSTLIVRLSSAQIDRSAVSLMVQELASIYEGQVNLSHRPSFFEYMRNAQAANTQGAIDYWKKELEGAQVTQFISHPKPYPPASDIRSLCQVISIDPISEYGLNFGTVLKAAWAIVLAQYAGSHDVVFGEVAHGQTIPVPDDFDITSLIAPTANVVPIRVTFTDTQEAPLDFMRMIQEKSAVSKSYETLGILELVQQCTDWAYWTRFSTVVQHRHQPPLDGATTLNMGDTTFTHSVIEPGVQDVPDIFVSTTMNTPQTVNVELKYSQGRVPAKFAEDALRVFIIAVDMITSFDTIEKPMVQSATEITRSPPKIPLVEAAGLGDSDTVKSNHGLSHDERKSLQSVISLVWTDILDPKSLGVPDDHIHKANFFDLWGSVLPAQTLADSLNTEFLKQPIKGLHKLKVTPVEIITNPTMASQYALVVRKMTEAGIITNTVRRKPTLTISSREDHGPRSGGSSPMEPNRWLGAEGEQNQSVFKRVGKLKTSGSVRSKAGDLLRRHRSTRAREQNDQPKAVTIGEPTPTELPPRAMQLRNEVQEYESRRMSPMDGRPPPLTIRTERGAHQVLEPLSEAAELSVNSTNPGQSASPRAYLSPNVDLHSGRALSPSISSHHAPCLSANMYDRQAVSPEPAELQSPTVIPGLEVCSTPALRPMPQRRASGDSEESNEQDVMRPLGAAWLAI